MNLEKAKKLLRDTYDWDKGEMKPISHKEFPAYIRKRTAEMENAVLEEVLEGLFEKHKHGSKVGIIKETPNTMKIVKPKKTAPLIIEDVIVDGKKKISVRIESPEDRWREFLS